MHGFVRSSVALAPARKRFLRLNGLGNFPNLKQPECGPIHRLTRIRLLPSAQYQIWQEERDRADAKHRGAVLAREQTKSKLTQAERDRDAAFARLAGLRKQLATRGAPAPDAGGGSDGPSPAGIGLFGECLGRAKSLGRRLGEVGTDAVGWAIRVNGLQGCIRALQAK